MEIDKAICSYRRKSFGAVKAVHITKALFTVSSFLVTFLQRANRIAILPCPKSYVLLQ